MIYEKVHQENETLSTLFLNHGTVKRRREIKGKDTHRNLTEILGAVKLIGGGEMARRNV